MAEDGIIEPDSPLNNPKEDNTSETQPEAKRLKTEPVVVIETSGDKSDELNNVVVDEEKLSLLSEDDLRKLCLKKERYIKHLENTASQLKSNLSDSQSNFENKLKQQQLDSIRKENIVIMRLTLKEQELQECLNQIEALKQMRLPTSTQLQSYLLDPALNYMFERMKKEVDVSKNRVEEMESELNAWKFSSDSVTGKQLMAKCRLLHQENEELGKMISSGKIAKLEAGLAMHKKCSEEMKKSQSEIEDVLMEMEEDIEGFQNTVYHLQQQLKEYKEKNLELENRLSELSVDK